MFPGGCANAALVPLTNLTQRLYGTYFRNPMAVNGSSFSEAVLNIWSPALSPLCGAALCGSPNFGCGLGCACFYRGTTLSVVGLYFADPCYSAPHVVRNGTYVTLSGVVSTDAYGEVAAGSTGAVTCAASVGPQPPRRPPTPP